MFILFIFNLQVKRVSFSDLVASEPYIMVYSKTEGILILYNIMEHLGNIAAVTNYNLLTYLTLLLIIT